MYAIEISMVYAPTVCKQVNFTYVSVGIQHAFDAKSTDIAIAKKCLLITMRRTFQSAVQRRKINWTRLSSIYHHRCTQTMVHTSTVLKDLAGV